MILPIGGAQACRPIGLDRRQPVLASEDGQIVNYGNMKKSQTLLENQNMSNIGLAIY